MQITEIYKSIQGESTFAGRPCVFVRTTGCNLRCVWCDTEYAFYGGKKMSIEQVMTRIKSFDCDLVEITGGEPLLQKEVPQLARRLILDGYTVLIETSGERDISVLDPGVIKIMDLKCPGSGEGDKNRWQNLQHITTRDEIKFVIKDRRDYEWAVDIVKQHELTGKCEVLFSPVWDDLSFKQLAKWIISDNLNVRYQIQMHKVIWSPETQGV